MKEREREKAKEKRRIKKRQQEDIIVFKRETPMKK